MSLGAVRRYPWLFLALLAVVGVGVLAVFPVQAYFDQGRERARLAAAVSDIEAHAAGLRSRIEELDSDAEIERLARERYQLVRPGEEAYVILPDGSPPPPPPPPASVPDEPGWWDRAWDRVTSAFS